jgi:predicted small lipoprotein YifL
MVARVQTPGVKLDNINMEETAPMMLRIFLIAAVSLSLFACGVKSSLDVPPGATQPQKGAPDPSKPPKPIGT